MNKDDSKLPSGANEINGESQFAPFLDEIIDAGNLELVTEDHVPAREEQWPPHHSDSKHLLQEISMVKTCTGFDEHAFRERCQRMQSELCQEFKRALIVRVITNSNIYRNC